MQPASNWTAVVGADRELEVSTRIGHAPTRPKADRQHYDREFFDYCKANPGKIKIASSGSGASVHLSGELFNSMTGCDMMHVPYRGAEPALTDPIGGQVHVIFDNFPSSVLDIKAGKFRQLAVISAERVPGMSQGALRDIIDKVNAKVNRALADPKMRERPAELCGKPIAGTL